jgi:methyltransferase (TIGR00027 family)
MTRAAGKTGTGPAATVAIEQHFPRGQRIIEDNLAYSILPFAMRAFVWLTRPPFIRDWMVRSLEKSAPGIWGGLMCRKRYIDEKLAESVGRIDAVVNPGAGFDTRAYRLPFLTDMPVWEIDQRGNIKAKQVRLRALFGNVPAHVTLVPVDFDREKLDAVLTAQGYPADARTFFILEAVTQYLTESGIRELFGFLAKAASGSRLVFTYVLKDFLNGSNTHGQDKLYKKYVIKGKLWLWGLDPEHASEFLAEYGWHIIEHPTYEEMAEWYVKPAGRELASTPIERIVYAEKQ